MLEEFLTVNIFSFFLIFARVGASIMLLPGFSSPMVNVRIRLLFTLAVSLLMTPILSGSLPGIPATTADMVLLVGGEVIVGAFLGTIGRILVSALQTAGTAISLVSSMANVLVQDAISQQQSSLISNFLSNTGLLMIFAANMHHLMLQAVADSYSLFVPGQPIPFGDFADFLAHRLTESFALGLQMASPLMITGIVYYIGIGLLGRLMPMLPLFLFGMPFQIAAQIWILMLSLSAMMMVFMNNFDEAFSAYLTP